MANVVFVTGNANKAKYFSELIGMPMEHHAADAIEIQSLNLVEIATHKVRQAYAQLNRPVIVEDVSLAINCMGKLPGPFIKWFIEELGLEKVCRLADVDKARRAVASSAYVYYDGQKIKCFEGRLEGSVAEHSRGNNGFGWNSIFVPDGTDKTLGEMKDKTFKNYYVQIKPFEQIKEFLAELDKA